MYQIFLVGNAIHATITYLKQYFFAVGMWSFSFRLMKFEIYINMKYRVVRYHSIFKSGRGNPSEPSNT
jgi:hypothetical protein